MKKFYRIFLLLIIFIFLSTYSPNKFDLTLENNSDFFKINKIVILNNLLVKKNNIKDIIALARIYKNSPQLFIFDTNVNYLIYLCKLLKRYNIINLVKFVKYKRKYK